MTLRLQPFFVDMHAVEALDVVGGEGIIPEKTMIQTCSSLCSTENGSVETATVPLSPAPQIFPTEASEDSLYSMWKVATKVKSVMVDGARFENLTWRAWHRKNQLERVERERRISGTRVCGMSPLGGMISPARAEGMPGNSIGSNDFKEAALSREENSSGNCDGCPPPAQATAIPRAGSFGRSAVYNQGYSSILAEIQAAGARKGPSEYSRLSVTSPAPVGSLLSTPSDLRGPASSDTTVPTLSIECATIVTTTAPRHLQEAYHHQTDSLHLAYSGGSASSQDSIRSTHQQPHMPGTPAGRRRKKNVDRFIKRHLNQPQHLLDVIAETLDEPTKNNGGEVQPLIGEDFSASEANNLTTASEDYVPGGSSLESREQAAGAGGRTSAEGPPIIPQDDSGVTEGVDSAKSSSSVSTLICSPPPAGRGCNGGGISLLTLLLNRNNSVEVRRSTIDQTFPRAQSLVVAPPPSRPEAPHPPLAVPDHHHNAGKDGNRRAGAVSKSPVIVLLPVPVASDLVESSPCASLASQMATDSSSAEHLSEGHSSSAVGSSSTASQGPRRRTGLPPPEFTAPLYIW